MGANHNLKNRDNMDIHKVFISLVLTLFIAGQLAAGVVAIEELVGTPILARGSEQLQGIFLFLGGGEGLRQRGCVCCRLGRVAVLSPIFVAELLFMVAALLLLRRPSIILKLFFGHNGVLGGVLGEVLWRSVSSPAFAKWWGISSPLMGSGSGSLVSMPARADFFCSVACSGCWSR
jgi:hypothetical protein